MHTLRHRIIFKSISVPVPLQAVLVRLGYRSGVTNVKESLMREIRATVREAGQLLALKGTATRLRIISVDDGCIRFQGNGSMHSRQLAQMLVGCDEMLLLGVTAGGRIMQAIRRDSAAQNLARAVVLDAVASEMVDSALEWMMAYANRLLTKENRMLTQRRFSCGYGDFRLENQAVMCRLLKMRQLGVRLTKRCILIPEKSVTAIAGICPVRKRPDKNRKRP